MRWLRIAPVAAFVVLGAAMGAALFTNPPREAALDAVRPMPAFTLTPLNETRQAFAREDLLGQVSLVNVFNSRCPSCVLEHPTLAQLTETGAAAIYGVAWLDPPGAAAQFLARYGDPYRAVGEDAAGRLGAALGVTGTPETFIIDKAGQVRFRQVGPITPDVWRGTIAPLVAQLEAEPPPAS